MQRVPKLSSFPFRYASSRGAVRSVPALPQHFAGTISLLRCIAVSVFRSAVVTRCTATPIVAPKFPAFLSLPIKIICKIACPPTST